MTSHTTAGPTAVILAAGQGGRLRSASDALPKPLVPVLGVSLAEWSIVQLAEAGAARFVVAVGYESSVVTRHFCEIAERRSVELTMRTVGNWRAGNGSSALAVRECVGPTPFLLAMVDHVASPDVIRRVVREVPGFGELVLAVDFNPGPGVDVGDLTKVQVEDGRVVAIGKDLRRWNGGDTGFFHCGPGLFEALECAQRGGDYSLTGGVRECARTGDVRVTDVSGRFWVDVDTPATLRTAEEWMRQPGVATPVSPLPVRARR